MMPQPTPATLVLGRRNFVPKVKKTGKLLNTGTDINSSIRQM
jgi:hypothetical protein